MLLIKEIQTSTNKNYLLLDFKSFNLENVKLFKEIISEVEREFIKKRGKQICILYIKIPFSIRVHKELIESGYQTNTPLIGMYLTLSQIRTFHMPERYHRILKIVELKNKEINDYLIIYKDVFKIPISLEALHKITKKYILLLEKKKKRYRIFVLLKEGKIIGFAAFSRDEKTLHLQNFGISENERRKGYGTFFLHSLAKTLYNDGYNKITLDVSLENLAAIQFYMNLGFRVENKEIIYMKIKI